ncbi:MAG: DUF2321 domain-containing protein [Bacillota bacterium]
MGFYHTSQVCLNGHVITDRYDSSPEFRRKFCPKCGAATITACPSCNTPIQGDYEVQGVGVLSGRLTPAPTFCHNCGKRFPWTEARARAAQELIELQDGLSDDDRSVLKKSVEDIMVDSPQTAVAATRLKVFLSRAGKALAPVMEKILVEIATTAAKKTMFGD